MRTPASIAGHPLHAMLIVFPVGLLIFSLICDLCSLGSANPATWATVALYTMVGGFIGALVAAVPGLIDLLSLTDPSDQEDRDHSYVDQSRCGGAFRGEHLAARRRRGQYRNAVDPVGDRHRDSGRVGLARRRNGASARRGGRHDAASVAIPARGSLPGLRVKPRRRSFPARPRAAPRPGTRRCRVAAALRRTASGARCAHPDSRGTDRGYGG